MTTALGVAPDSAGKGVDPLTHRQIIKAHWASTGIVCGLGVSGRTDLRYNVAAGVSVCSRGAADGYTEAYWSGGQTPAVAAGDPSNPRVDTVWIKACDISQGDSDNQVTIGVAQGTPSANPAAPTLPAGCVRLANMCMKAGATSTQNATLATGAATAIPFAVSGGKLASSRVTAQYTVQEDKAWHEQVRISFALPTKRNVRLRWKACSTVGRGDGKDANTRQGSYFIQCRVDGKIINDLPSYGDGLAGQMADEILSTRYSTTEVLEWDCTLAAGVHQVSVWAYGNKAYLAYPVQLRSRMLEAIDMGIAA